jgi:NAD(P)H-hydrate epimerase
MREVDRVAVQDVGLQLLQMMENAGRNLAKTVRDILPAEGDVVVLAGDGGNGGGGLACARHLANHGVTVSVVLDRHTDDLTGAAATQYAVLDAMDLPITVTPEESPENAVPDQSLSGTVVVDSLVGYGLEGPLRGRAGELVAAMPATAALVSLDVPTGRNATTGAEPGVSVRPDFVVTLALPKTGLAGLDATILLADIAIPAVVYDRLSIPYRSPFDGAHLIELVAA